MRIDAFQNIPAILESLKSSKKPSSSAAPETPVAASSLSLSSFAEVLKTVQRHAAQESQIRSVKVAELADREKSGNLNVNTSKLAEKLVEMGIVNAGE